MNQRAVAMIGRLDAHKLQQFVKWTVYALLLLNFVLYIFEDANRAMHSIHSGSTLLDLSSEFATTIDEAAWFFLLLMFELETYVLDDEKWKGWVAIAIHGLRLVCFVMIAHTIFAFAIYMADIRPTKPVEN